MILPILISVSLAPGSYFFCALAAVAVTTAAAANAVTAKRLLIRDGIVLSPLGNYFDRLSQVMLAHASNHLFRGTKQHCCSSPIMIDAGGSSWIVIDKGRRIEPEITNWPATSQARPSRISRRAMARRANHGGRGLSSTRLGLCRRPDGTRPRKARPRRDRLSGWARASRHA